MSYFAKLQQNVIVSTNNSSTGNLGPGSTFTGTSDDTLGVAAIQVLLKADQNCSVYIEQSSDGINWDISDYHEYRHALGGASWTTQAVGSYFRVRVTNASAVTATTYLRLQSILCPIMEAVPRSLSDEGNLKVGVYEIEGDFGAKVEITPTNSLKVAQHTKLVGSNFAAAFDANFWQQLVATGSASSVVANSELTMSTGTTTASSNVVRSVRTARFVAGSSCHFEAVVELPTAVGVNTRRWGAFDGTDGFYFEHDGTTLSVVCLKGGVADKTDSGDFNGFLGDTFDPSTGSHVYEIHWNNRKAWFSVDDELLHTCGPDGLLVNKLSLPIRFENTNGANTNNNQLKVRTASIARDGPLMAAPHYYHIDALGTYVLKSGPGGIHRIVIGILPGAVGTVTLYDNTTGTGTVIWRGQFKQINTVAVPLSMDFGGVPFSTGLTVVVADQIVDFTVIYE